jgi:hypothetical protein
MSGYNRRSRTKHLYGLVRGAPSQQSVPKPPTPKTHKRLLLALGLAVCGVAIITGVIAAVRRAASTVQEPVAVATVIQPLLKDAQPNLQTTNTAALQVTVAKLQAVTGYQTDQNALYVMVEYYILVGDASQARGALTKLYAVYNSKTGFSPILGKTKTMLQLESDVTFIETQAKNFTSNLAKGLVPQ